VGFLCATGARASRDRRLACFLPIAVYRPFRPHHPLNLGRLGFNFARDYPSANSSSSADSCIPQSNASSYDPTRAPTNSSTASSPSTNSRTYQFECFAIHSLVHRSSIDTTSPMSSSTMPSSSSATSSAPTCTSTLAYVPPTGTSLFPVTGHVGFNIEGQP
jgi:hypothetical protein